MVYDTKPQLVTITHLNFRIDTPSSSSTALASKVKADYQSAFRLLVYSHIHSNAKEGQNNVKNI